MPVGKRFDFQLDGKGYMLVRGQGRAWSRTGLPDTPGKRSPDDYQYGVLPPEIDDPEVWDDWSGGAFHPYRRKGENTYHWAENFDARFPRQLVHAQAWMTPTGAAVPDGTQNLNFNQIIDGPSRSATEARRPGTGSVLSVGLKHFDAIEPTGSGFDFFGTITSDAVSYVGRPAIFGSFFYVGVLEATQFMRLNMIYGIVNTDSHTMQAKNFAAVGDRLWKASTAKDDVNGPVRYVQNTAADPTVTANWAATYQVGNGSDSVKDMIGFEDQLFLGLESGLYAGDASGTFVNVTPELATQRHYDNCRDLRAYEGGVALTHVSGIYHYRPNGESATVEQIGPPSPALRNPIGGYPRALANCGPWLLAGYWTGSQSFLLAGKFQGNSHIWHPLNSFSRSDGQLPVSKINRLHVDGITVASGGGIQMPNRLWAITDASLGLTGSAPRYFMPVPFQFGNPLSGGMGFSPNYIGSARIDLGNVDSGAPGTPKSYRALEVWADNLLSGYRYCDVYYYGDQTTSQLYLGRAQNSPKDTLYFPSGDGVALTYQLTGAVATVSYPTGLIVTNVAHDERVTISYGVANAGGVNWRLQGINTLGSQVNISAPFNTTGTMYTAEPRTAGDIVSIHLWPNGNANSSTDITIGISRHVPESANSIELSIRSFTASPYLSPVYRGFILRSATRPNSVDTITAQVRIADGIRDRQGGEMRTGATLISELRDLTQRDTPITLIDLVGAQYLVNVLPPIQEQEYYQKGEDYPELMATVKLAVMAYS